MLGRKTPEGNGKKVAVFFIPALFVVVLGAMFKIMHWPGSSVMLIAGLSYSAFGVLVGVFKKNDDEPVEKVGFGRKLFVGLIVALSLFVVFNGGGYFISRDLLSGFVQTQISIDQKTFERSREVESMYELLLNDPSNVNTVTELRTTAKRAIDMIEENKRDIISLSGGDVGDQDAAIMYYLVHEDGQYGRNLIKSINQFKLAVRPLFSDSLKHAVLDVRMSTKEEVIDENVMVTWIQYLCEHLPVAVVLSNLSLWQSYIQDAEIIALDQILKRSQEE